MTKSNRYGLKIDEVTPDMWVMGSNSQVPFEILQEDADWSDYLPTKEFQNLNNIEPYACVTFTVLNCIEAIIKRKYGIDENFSDRFLATVSGTKEGGNTAHNVCEFLRKIGVVSQDLYPFDNSVTSFEEFYKPIPPKLYELAQEFNRKYTFKHDNVPAKDDKIHEALKTSPLLMSVAAWNLGEDNLYYRPQGMQDNHATTLFYERVGSFRRVFDSYDNPHIKDVRYIDTPMVIKRFWIEKNTYPQPQIVKRGIIQNILTWLRNFFSN